MTKPNNSISVMSSRQNPSDDLDYFPTPRWATRALCEKLGFYQPLNVLTCWEPACGQGYMSETLKGYFYKVFASDVKDYDCPPGVQDAVASFICPLFHPRVMQDNPPDWVITNPPFNKAAEFISTARSIARVGYAMFVRTSFLEGMGRYKGIYSEFPPRFCWVFSPRVSLVKGRVDSDVASATSYSWLVWLKGWKGAPELGWLARKRELIFEGDASLPCGVS